MVIGLRSLDAGDIAACGALSIPRACTDSLRRLHRVEGSQNVRVRAVCSLLVNSVKPGKTEVSLNTSLNEELVGASGKECVCSLSNAVIGWKSGDARGIVTLETSACGRRRTGRENRVAGTSIGRSMPYFNVEQALQSLLQLVAIRVSAEQTEGACRARPVHFHRKTS